MEWQQGFYIHTKSCGVFVIGSNYRRVSAAPFWLEINVEKEFYIQFRLQPNFCS